jgi:hypothetical protein
MMAMCENEGFLVCREKEKERGRRREVDVVLCGEKSGVSYV